MTGFAATHTGSLTPSSDPWTFVGTVTWQSDIDPAILPRQSIPRPGADHHLRYPTSLMNQRAALDALLAQLDGNN